VSVGRGVAVGTKKVEPLRFGFRIPLNV